jgi:hypothetical protein
LAQRGFLPLQVLLVETPERFLFRGKDESFRLSYFQKLAHSLKNPLKTRMDAWMFSEGLAFEVTSRATRHSLFPSLFEGRVDSRWGHVKPCDRLPCSLRYPGQFGIGVERSDESLRKDTDARLPERV